MKVRFPLVRHASAKSDLVDMSAAVTRRMRFVARDGGERAFTDFAVSPAFSQRLSRLLGQAGNIHFEIGQGVILSPQSLARVLEHSIQVALRLEGNLRAMVVEMDSRKRQVMVAPRTWSEDETRSRELLGFRAVIRALSIVESALSAAESREEAELIIARTLFGELKACGVKAYDVAEDGSVRVSHSFVWEGGEARRVSREQTPSHFANWVPPEGFVGEAMGAIVVREQSHVLITDPAQDARSVLIAERVSDQLTRVYKVDWEDPEDLLTFSRLAIRFLFQRLAEFKQRLTYEEERKFLDDISQIVATEAKITRVLARISDKIATFFKSNGKGIVADRITIMLHDAATGSLITQVIWTADGIREESFYCGPEDPGIGRKVFELGDTIYLRRIADWRGEKVQWMRGGQGSLVGTIVSGSEGKLGVIIVSSLREDAFTEGQIRVLEDVSQRVGPAFERIVRHMELLNLDPKFGLPQFGGLKVYNACYLSQRLKSDIELAQREGRPLSLIFMDIDDFKALNEAWLHADVDYVLAEIFRQMIANLREGEVYRQGGEETIVRLPIPLEKAVVVAERIRIALDKPITVWIPFKDRVEAARRLALIRENQGRWPNHGIQEARVEMRRGEPCLVVTVRKTVSVGVDEYRKGDDPESLIDRVDALQQEAKRRGKNRVVSTQSAGRI